MNAGIKKVICFVVGGIVVTTAVSWWIDSRRSGDAKRTLEETRRELRAQGFKTEFRDFDFKTDDATRARAAALVAGGWMRLYDPHIIRVDLMPEVSQGTAVVVWKESRVICTAGAYDWSDLYSVLDTNRDALDAACSAALSGPIRFEPKVSDNEDMWGVNTAQLRPLMVELSLRIMLELHDGNPDLAWTNLMVATRIVTARQPEPTEFACILQMAFARMAFLATWQALQFGGWPDASLAALQREWESADFFTNLPETAAFCRVLAANESKHLGLEPLAGDFTFSELAKETFRNPAQAHADIKNAVNLLSYRGREQEEDEKNVLLYFRDWEVELRHAIQSPTWATMRTQPGVTNVPVFSCWYPPMQEWMASKARAGTLVVAGAAEAEARRRIIITAIALERYRVRHGRYPATLASLAPEFLNTVPVDFMNGQPLHYRLTEDGHFVLYSVGIDCIDHGGKMPVFKVPNLFNIASPLLAKTNVDIMWPRPDFSGGTK